MKARLCSTSTVTDLLVIAPDTSVAENVMRWAPTSAAAGRHTNSPVMVSKAAPLGRSDTEAETGRFCWSVATMAKRTSSFGADTILSGTLTVARPGAAIPSLPWTRLFPSRPSIVATPGVASLDTVAINLRCRWPLRETTRSGTATDRRSLEIATARVSDSDAALSPMPHTAVLPGTT